MHFEKKTCFGFNHIYADILFPYYFEALRTSLIDLRNLYEEFYAKLFISHFPRIFITRVVAMEQC